MLARLVGSIKLTTSDFMASLLKERFFCGIT